MLAHIFTAFGVDGMDDGYLTLTIYQGVHITYFKVKGQITECYCFYRPLSLHFTDVFFAHMTQGSFCKR